RAATFAAAVISAAVGLSGSATRASIPSITPSPFLSRKTGPVLKKSLNAAGLGEEPGASALRADPSSGASRRSAADATKNRFMTLAGFYRRVQNKRAPRYCGPPLPTGLAPPAFTAPCRNQANERCPALSQGMCRALCSENAQFSQERMVVERRLCRR